MNKIYKVIYSKVRNCYIVVSELAKSHDSAHGTRSRSGCARKAAVLAAFVLTTTLAAVPVWAADSKGNINNVVTKKIISQIGRLWMVPIILMGLIMWYMGLAILLINRGLL